MVPSLMTLHQDRMMVNQDHTLVNQDHMLVNRHHMVVNHHHMVGNQDRMVGNQDLMVVNQALTQPSPLVASVASPMDNHNGAPQEFKFSDLVDDLLPVDTMVVVASLQPSRGQLSRMLRQSKCRSSTKSPSETNQV